MCGDYEYEYYTDGTAGITNYTGTEKEVAVHSKPDGHPVSVIGDRAFMSRADDLAAIRLPDSVTSIGECAFCYCTRLSSVNIPESVTAIGDGAFFCCESLASVTIPDSVTSIGERAFAECASLTLTVPRGSYAERYCRDNGLAYRYPD